MWYVREGDITKIFIYVQPGAKVTEITGIFNDSLKIRLNAPPIDGRANVMLKKFLAKLFDVPLNKVMLIRGEKNRRKVFEILGSLVDPEYLI
jgi:uncharacterized protein (TIGR00251 family)